MIDLLNEIGGCVLYHDYRSGSFRDWSGNGNHGTPTGAGLTRDGAGFTDQSSLVTVPYSAELDIGNGDGMSSVMHFAGRLRSNETGTTRRFYEQVGGIAAYLDVDNNTVVFLIDNAPSVLAGVAAKLNDVRNVSFSWADGAAPNLYANGVFISAFPTVLAKGSGTADIGVGNRLLSGRVLGQTMSAICLFNKALTATEHAQVYGALKAARWPHKVYSHAKSRIEVDTADTGLVGAWDMRAVGGTVFDKSGNGNDGSPSYLGLGDTDISFFNTVLGRAANFDGLAGAINCGTSDSLNFGTGDFSFIAWARTPGAASRRLCQKGSSGSASYKVGFDASNKPYFEIQDGVNTLTVTAAGAVTDFIWHQIAIVADRDSQAGCRVYIDGVNDTDTRVGTVTSVGTITNASDFRLGSYGGSTYLIGDVADVKLFNRALTPDEIAAEYAKGAQTVTFKTDFGARETSAAVTSGPLSNTPFEVVSGSFNVVTDTIDGRPVRALKCVTAGVVAMPASLFRVGAAGAARGTFEWWVYKATPGTQPRVCFIASQKTAPTATGFDGYEILLNNDDAYSMYYRVSGSRTLMQLTAAGYLSSGQWNKYRVTVGEGGVFTTYMNDTLVDVTGGSGTNPITNATNTESKFLTFEPEVGDMIALGDVKGDYAITHYLGVV